MNKVTYDHGIAELCMFFKSFKPSSGQRNAWWRRLKNAPENAFRLAVYRITETRDATPSFAILKQEMHKAAADLSPEKDPITLREILGGAAPRSDAKIALVKAHMAGMAELLQQRHKMTPEILKDYARSLKRSYVIQFKKLPGFITRAHALSLCRHRDWAELVRYGYITEEQAAPRVTPYYPKRFESEGGGNTVEVRPGGVVMS